MKSKVILMNSNDPKYLDLKQIIDNIRIWQVLDFECITTSKSNMAKVDFNRNILPISFVSINNKNKVHKYISLKYDFSEFIDNLIETYEGGKIFVWDQHIEKTIFDFFIKETESPDKQKILRIMKYNIIDLQKIFQGEQLIVINDQNRSASLNDWSIFFDMKKTPISSKLIALKGYEILVQLKKWEITQSSSKVKKYIKNTIKHNEIDVLTIKRIFNMIKDDRNTMVFLNEVEDEEFDLQI